MRIFCLCVYSFWICLSSLDVFGAYFALLGMTLASVWLPWAALGPLWGASGCHGGRFGMPRGIYWVFNKIGRQIQSKWFSSTQPAHKKCPPGFLPQYPRIPPIGVKCDLARSSQSPLQSRRGPGARQSNTLPQTSVFG